MRRGHRTAHPRVVFASGALAVGMFLYGWSVRSARPFAPPVAAPAPPPGATWEATIQTPVGPATVSYFDDATGPFLWASLPFGLDAAEPGLVLEVAGEPPRALGSIAPGRPVVPLPGGLAGEAGTETSSDGVGRSRRLVLVDFARSLRLGWADLDVHGGIR